MQKRNSRTRRIRTSSRYAWHLPQQAHSRVLSLDSIQSAVYSSDGRCNALALDSCWCLLTSAQQGHYIVTMSAPRRSLT